MPICDKIALPANSPTASTITMDAEDYAEARGRDKLLQCPTGQGRRPDRTVEELTARADGPQERLQPRLVRKNRDTILAKAKARRESDPEYAAQRQGIPPRALSGEPRRKSSTGRGLSEGAPRRNPRLAEGLLRGEPRKGRREEPHL